MPRRKLKTQFTLKGNWRPGAYTPFSKILPHLFQGDCDGVHDSKFLRKHHITHVVTMGFVGPPEEVVAALDLRVCELEVKDSAGARVDKHFDEAVRFIHEGRSSNGTLYVHCYSGTSASSAVVAAYLMVWLDVSYADAIRFVRHCRPCADPNPSLKKQLKNFGSDTAKIAALREKLMKMGPAKKRDERLEEDTKLFTAAMEIESAKDDASGVQKVSVDNGVVDTSNDTDNDKDKDESVAVSEREMEEEKLVPAPDATEKQAEAKDAAARASASAAVESSAEPANGDDSKDNASAAATSEDVGGGDGQSNGDAEEKEGGDDDAAGESPPSARVEGNLEEAVP